MFVTCVKWILVMTDMKSCAIDKYLRKKLTFDLNLLQQPDF